MKEIRKRAIKISFNDKLDGLKEIPISYYLFMLCFLPMGMIFVIMVIGSFILGILETAITGKETFQYDYENPIVNWDMEVLEQIENERLAIENKHCYLMCHETKK